MEKLVNPAFWAGRRVFLTGHTGFKGGWLSLWLQAMGAEVWGFSLAPSTPVSLFDVASVTTGMHSRLGDIRDLNALTQAMAQARPDIVLHLAAQALVPLSYEQPLETFSTNVMGTANVLEAVRRTPGVRAVVAVSSDKCYENQEWVWGYRETDPMGGYDPYSASKGCTELVVASYRRSFLNAAKVPVASARAGNVIGGGDWSEDRLIPDVVRAVTQGTEVEIRSPAATRPWQHVLESLSGYLLLGQHLLAREHVAAEAWNFGPAEEGNRPVQAVMERIASLWPAMRWHSANNADVHEARLLYLDSAKSRAGLKWQPVWGFDDALAATVGWYRAYLTDGAMISAQQLEQYVQAARDAGLAWCRP